MTVKKPFPWAKTYSGIKARCNNKNNKYFKRGIKCLITSDELKALWFRDKGFLLERPSIDRIDNNGNYEFSNCRYIELSENARLGMGEGQREVCIKNIEVSNNKMLHYKRKVACYKDGKMVRVFKSVTNAAKYHNVSLVAIINSCKLPSRKCRGMKWEYLTTR